MTTSRAVLVTGCSSGIGRATVVRLLRRDRPVYATARRVETIADLEQQGARTLRLDLEDEDSMAAAVRHIEEHDGAVGALINNAGYGLQGAIETTSLASVRRQFETNFFGPARLTQMVLPGMRRQGSGRIINMSSMGGKIELPGGGYYHASKHALEAYSDVLRYEVRSFGIDVVIIEPGLIKSRFGDTAVATVSGDVEDSPYAEFNDKVSALLSHAYGEGFSLVAAPPDAVAKVVVRALQSRRPRTRYVVTVGARLALLSRAALPDRVWDAAVGRVYPRPRPDKRNSPA